MKQSKPKRLSILGCENEDQLVGCEGVVCWNKELGRYVCDECNAVYEEMEEEAEEVKEK